MTRSKTCQINLPSLLWKWPLILSRRSFKKKEQRQTDLKILRYNVDRSYLGLKVQVGNSWLHSHFWKPCGLLHFVTKSATFTPGSLALVSDLFFSQSLVSIECYCVFFFWSLYIPSNVSELLQYYLPHIWLFLLLCPKALGKFWVFQWFWRLGHLFSSSSLQSWMLFIATLQSFTLSSVSCCNLWELSAGRSLCLMLLGPEVWAAL